MKVISVSKLVLVLNCSPESSLFAKLCEYVYIRLIEISFSRNTIFSERASTRHVEALSLKMIFLFLWFRMFDTVVVSREKSYLTDFVLPRKLSNNSKWRAGIQSFRTHGSFVPRL